MNSSPTSSPAQEALKKGEYLLSKLAVKLGLNVERKPCYSSRIFFGGEDVYAAKIEAPDLPNHVIGLQVGRYAVLLTLLPEAVDEDGIGEIVRRVRNQCVVAKSYLSAPLTVDLHVIFLGPCGSEGDDKWKALSLFVERDERAARKLVWLRPQDSSIDENSFIDFSKRSFLARPWVTTSIFSMAPLDNVSRTAISGDISDETIREWTRLAVEPDIDPEILVNQLVAAWKPESAS